MKLCQLVYVSRLTTAFSSEALGQLIEQSSIRNATLDVSGILLCHGRQLMQLLEGEPTVVMNLFLKIQADKRHTEVSVLLQKQVTKRLYPEWGMGMADLNANHTVDRERLMRMIHDVQKANNTAGFSVEARMLLQDFTMQLIHAA